MTSGSGQEKTGEKKIIRFKNCIIAAGSAPVHLPFIPEEGGFQGTIERAMLRRRMATIKEQLRNTSWLAEDDAGSIEDFENFPV